MAASLKCVGLFKVIPLFSHTVQQHIPQQLRMNLNCVPVMYMSTKKHYDPKFRKYRRLKMDMRPINLYEKQQKREKMSKDEMRIFLKKRGEYPQVTFAENSLNLGSTNAIIDEYEPPEADGKSSFLSRKVITKTKDWTKSKARTVRDRRALKKWEGSFDKKSIAFELQQIYIEAQKLLQDYKNNREKLFDYVTEYAFPSMTFGLENKTMRWEFIESVEPPKVVHIRVQPLLAKENHYAQLTVRMHTKQFIRGCFGLIWEQILSYTSSTYDCERFRHQDHQVLMKQSAHNFVKLAIYDRFGRIMYGSEHLIKDVLEYVIFEKHIVHEYGRWRVHSKIIPTWLPVREPLITTVRKPALKEPTDKTPTDSDVMIKQEEKVEKSGGGGGPGTPQLVTA